MLTLYDLNPDGVKVIVKWDKMVAGASVFVPCINTEKATNQLIKVTELKDWHTTIVTCIEGGRLGVRMYRLS
jgi:hypothetical protein